MRVHDYCEAPITLRPLLLKFGDVYGKEEGIARGLMSSIKGEPTITSFHRLSSMVRSSNLPFLPTALRIFSIIPNGDTVKGT